MSIKSCWGISVELTFSFNEELENETDIMGLALEDLASLKIGVVRWNYDLTLKSQLEIEQAIQREKDEACDTLGLAN